MIFFQKIYQFVGGFRKYAYICNQIKQKDNDEYNFYILVVALLKIKIVVSRKAM